MRILISAAMNFEYGLSAVELSMMPQPCPYYASTIEHRLNDVTEALPFPYECYACAIRYRSKCDASSLGDPVDRFLSIDCTWLQTTYITLVEAKTGQNV